MNHSWKATTSQITTANPTTAVSTLAMLIRVLLNNVPQDVTADRGRELLACLAVDGERMNSPFSLNGMAPPQVLQRQGGQPVP